MKDPGTLLIIALSIATAGMVLVVLGILHGALFSVGATLLAVGLLAAAAVGIYGAVRSPAERPPAR